MHDNIPVNIRGGREVSKPINRLGREHKTHVRQLDAIDRKFEVEAYEDFQQARLAEARAGYAAVLDKMEATIDAEYAEHVMVLATGQHRLIAQLAHGDAELQMTLQEIAQFWRLGACQKVMSRGRH